MDDIIRFYIYKALITVDLKKFGNDLKTEKLIENDIYVGCDFIMEREFENFSNLFVIILEERKNVKLVIHKYNKKFYNFFIKFTENKKLNNRIILFNDNYIEYLSEIHFYIHSTDIFIEFFMKNKMAAFPTINPFNYREISNKEQIINLFYNKDPFIFNYLSEKFNIKIKNTIDIGRLIYGAKLPLDVLENFINSELTGIDAYLEWVYMCIDYKEFAQHRKEIGYLRWLYNKKKYNHNNNSCDFKNILERI